MRRVAFVRLGAGLFWKRTIRRNVRAMSHNVQAMSPRCAGHVATMTGLFAGGVRVSTHDAARTCNQVRLQLSLFTLTFAPAHGGLNHRAGSQRAAIAQPVERRIRNA